MKKFILGCILFTVGILGLTLILCALIVNGGNSMSWTSQIGFWIEVIRDHILTIPVSILFIITITGATICYRETYRKK